MVIILINLLLLAAGFVLLIKGSDWFVMGASAVASKLGIPSLVIGLTIVAMGTSAPEAAVSIVSAVKGSAGISVGNVLGSNIMNILLILGITALIRPLPVQKSTVRYEIPFVIVISVIFAIAGITGNSIVFKEGIMLWILFIGYLIYLFRMTKNKGPEAEDLMAAAKDACHSAEVPSDVTGMPAWKLVLAIVIGVGLILAGSNIAVSAATKLAVIAGVSDRIIGLTIVAFGTSLPELCTSASAALRGENDIAVGNIVGSNVFNILFVAGTTALIRPIDFEEKFYFDAAIATLAAVILLLCTLRKRELTRAGGAIMLFIYAAYFIKLLI